MSEKDWSYGEESAPTPSANPSQASSIPAGWSYGEEPTPTSTTADDLAGTAKAIGIGAGKAFGLDKIANPAAAAIAATIGGGDFNAPTWSGRYDQALKAAQAGQAQVEAEHPTAVNVGEGAAGLAPYGLMPATKALSVPARLTLGAEQAVASGALANPDNRAEGAQSAGNIGAGFGLAGEAATGIAKAAAPAVDALRNKAAQLSFSQRVEEGLSKIKHIFNPEGKDTSLDGVIKRNSNIFENAGTPAKVAENAHTAAQESANTAKGIIQSTEANPISDEFIPSTFNDVSYKLEDLVNQATSIGNTDKKLKTVVDAVDTQMRKEGGQTLSNLQQIKQSIYKQANPKLYKNMGPHDDFSEEYKEVGNIIKEAIENHVEQVAGPEAAQTLAKANKAYGEQISLRDLYNASSARKVNALQGAGEATAVGVGSLIGGPAGAALSTGAVGAIHYLSTPSGQLKAANALDAVAKARGFSSRLMLPADVTAKIMESIDKTGEAPPDI